MIALKFHNLSNYRRRDFKKISKFCLFVKVLNMNGFRFNYLAGVLLIFVVCGNGFAQEQNTEEKKLNFGYSRNPSSRAKKSNDNNTNSTEQKPQISANINSENDFANSSAAQKTLDVAKRASIANLPPTEVYKVGVSDVLFISLQNAPAKSSTYFTVLNDGSIDYPLAGGMISVGGLTSEEIEDLLRNKISLYENPQVAVKIREYGSHSITVLGLVEKTGEKFIQREAVPLFVVKAESIVKPNADQAVIRRENKDLETVNLKDAKADEVLIFPGDIVEFKNSIADQKSNTPQFFYIGGNIISAGQKDFYQGMTLTQAILAAGGLRKSSAKSVVIRRKNEKDLLESIEFNLKDIKNGKIPDPTLQAGDTIEIAD
ncbi:hypothetical protein BH20ACI4_BH20ACI4_33770 [soil metagenome]